MVVNALVAFTHEVYTTARLFFRGRATPRGLSELMDNDDDDVENEKQKKSILRVGDDVRTTTA